MSRIIDKYKHDGITWAIVDDGTGAPLRMVSLGTVRDDPEPVRECQGQGRDGFDLEDLRMVEKWTGHESDKRAKRSALVISVVLALLFIVLVVALAWLV